MSKKTEPTIISNLRDLLTYISRLGVQMNQMNQRLDQIDASIRDVTRKLDLSIETNNKTVLSIKQTTITKTEFNQLIAKLNEPFKEFSPTKPPERARNRRG
jgi:4-hydroxy-3-methylbut-2-enyl diphosphate reductase IspH